MINKNTLSSQCIDNVSGDRNIVSLLNKYNKLNNAIHYDNTEMSTLCDMHVNDIHVHCIADTIKHTHTHCINVEQRKFAIKKFKPANQYRWFII